MTQRTLVHFDDPWWYGYNQDVPSLGVEIDLHKIPEFMEYHNYAFCGNRVTRWIRYTFKRDKIEQIKMSALNL